MLSKEKTTQHQEKDPFLLSLSLSSFQTHRRLIYYSTFKRFRFTSSLLLYQPSSPQLAQRAKDLSIQHFSLSLSPLTKKEGGGGPGINSPTNSCTYSIHTYILYTCLIRVHIHRQRKRQILYILYNVTIRYKRYNHCLGSSNNGGYMAELLDIGG